MNKNSIILGGVAVIIVILAAWWVFSQNASAPTTQTETVNNQEQQTPVVVENTTPAPKTYEIAFTDSGYVPSALTIKVGDTVVFKNMTTGGMWPASAMHPTHMLYGGTSLQDHCPDIENNDFDACKSIAAGQSWSFTFTKAGAWGFHDHLKLGNFGKITVE